MRASLLNKLQKAASLIAGHNSVGLLLFFVLDNKYEFGCCKLQIELCNKTPYQELTPSIASILGSFTTVEREHQLRRSILLICSKFENWGHISETTIPIIIRLPPKNISGPSISSSNQVAKRAAKIGSRL